MSARWIICEKTGQWAAALRWAGMGRAPRLYETRSLHECRQRLEGWPASLLTLEATMANVEDVLLLLEEARLLFPLSRAIVVSTPPMSRWEDSLREAGAVHVVLSPRRLEFVVQLAVRHLASLPRPRQGLRNAFWSRLPWGGDDAGAGRGQSSSA